MLRAGDEFMRTQAGNNNPYNQDNETAWLDWRRLDANADVLRFFRLMIAYDSRSLAFALHGASQRDDDLYVMINAYWEDLDFQVQEGTTAEWRRVVDTSLDSPLDFLEPGGENPLQSLRYRVAARSVAVLLRERTA